MVSYSHENKKHMLQALTLTKAEDYFDLDIELCYTAEVLLFSIRSQILTYCKKVVDLSITVFLNTVCLVINYSYTNHAVISYLFSFVATVITKSPVVLE